MGQNLIGIPIGSYAKSAECHKEGHFASVCRTKVSNERDNKKKINYTREDQESKEGDNEYAFVVNHQSDENSGLVDIKVGGVLCNFLIDSGSTCNVINKSCWEELKAKRIKCKSEKTWIKQAAKCCWEIYS